MTKKAITKKEVEGKTYRVDFRNSDFVPSYFATNIVVQRYEGDFFKVSFYESKPDIILTEEDRVNMEKRGTLRADCLGSYILTPNHMRRFIGALQTQLSKYEERINVASESNPSAET